VGLGIVLQKPQPVDQPRDHVPAQGKAGGRVAFLLPLQPSPFEKRLVCKDIG
jgi:hypothetical protein